MRQFIIRRILISILILFGVSVVIYALMRAMPSDFVAGLLSEKKDASPELAEKLRHLYGLDQGIIEGYFGWIKNAIRGDFGTSFVYQKPVSEVIWDKMWVSFWHAFVAFVLQIIIAVPLGIVSATKQYSKLDYGITTVALLGISLPSFFFAAILQKIFAMEFRVLPLQGMITAGTRYSGLAYIADMAWHYILPVIVLTVISVGSLMRYSRTNMLEVINADYIRTARAKGLSENAVIYKHAFRNTLIPIVTMVGSAIPGLFSGAMITEGIFAIDGIGYTALQALVKSDIPFLMGFNMFLAVLTLLGNLISDILYAVVDPRVRYN